MHNMSLSPCHCQMQPVVVEIYTTFLFFMLTSYIYLLHFFFRWQLYQIFYHCIIGINMFSTSSNSFFLPTARRQCHLFLVYCCCHSNTPFLVSIHVLTGRVGVEQSSNFSDLQEFVLWRSGLRIWFQWLGLLPRCQFDPWPGAGGLNDLALLQLWCRAQLPLRFSL